MIMSDDELKSFDNVEVKNFYPFEVREDILRGSLHVTIQLGGIELNIRGIFVLRGKDNRFYFRMPFKNGTNQAGISVPYPILSFSDNELNKILIKKIQEKAPAFISEFMATQNKAPEEPKPVEPRKEIPVPQKIAPKPASSAAVWVDPPKRKDLPKKPLARR
jgi:hypothetical protein